MDIKMSRGKRTKADCRTLICTRQKQHLLYTHQMHVQTYQQTQITVEAAWWEIDWLVSSGQRYAALISWHVKSFFNYPGSWGPYSQWESKPTNLHLFFFFLLSCHKSLNMFLDIGNTCVMTRGRQESNHLLHKAAVVGVTPVYSGATEVTPRPYFSHTPMWWTNHH